MSVEYLISERHHGMRLDKALAEIDENLSRARLQSLIKDGQVCVNDEVCTQNSRKLNEGDRVSFTVPPLEEAEPEPQDIPIDIVFEDDHLLVVNKPAGLVVHPGAGHQDGTLVNALLHHCGDTLSGIGGVLRPGIVHRLDKDTTGLMVVAKSDEAHHGLSEQLQDRSLSRVYQALVFGVPIPPVGEVFQPIGRHPRNRLKMAVNSQNGREARTFYKVTEQFGDIGSLVQCKLESGRTHQIRVHMEYLKHPILGDPLYGPQKTALESALKKGGVQDIDFIESFSRQALHAGEISFKHPISEENMGFFADLPEDFEKLILSLNY